MARHSGAAKVVVFTPAARLAFPFVAIAVIVSAWKIYDILTSRPSVPFQPLEEVRILEYLGSIL